MLEESSLSCFFALALTESSFLNKSWACRWGSPGVRWRSIKNFFCWTKSSTFCCSWTKAAKLQWQQNKLWNAGSSKQKGLSCIREMNMTSEYWKTQRWPFPSPHTEFLSVSMEGGIPIIWGCEKHWANLPFLRQTIMEEQRLSPAGWSKVLLIYNSTGWHRCFVMSHTSLHYTKQQCCHINAGPKLHAGHDSHRWVLIPTLQPRTVTPRNSPLYIHLSMK